MNRKSGFFLAALASVSLAAAVNPTAYAQHNGKKAHTTAVSKPAHDTTNRVVRTDIGISYVPPAEYNERESPAPIVLRLDGPRTNQRVTVDQTAHGYTNVYLITSIMLITTPHNPNKPWTDVNFSAATANKILDALNALTRQTGVLLNYQNSAKIQVAGHDALAILAETSLDRTSDRALVRLVVLPHGTRQYLFVFQAVDAEFETRVPAFENFMNSLKFLEPDIAPGTAPTPGPVQVKIGS